jgi:hypothetical protein
MFESNFTENAADTPIEVRDAGPKTALAVTMQLE